MGENFPPITDVLRLDLDPSLKIETFFAFSTRIFSCFFAYKIYRMIMTVGMWYQTCVWFLFSSFLVHALAALAAFYCLRKHKVARYYSVIILAMGILGPLTGGIITSAVIAGLFHTTDIHMYPLWALVCGWGQTLMVILISFLRILATL